MSRKEVSQQIDKMYKTIRRLERENIALNWAIKRIELLSLVKANSELNEAIRATIEEAKKAQL